MGRPIFRAQRTLYIARLAPATTSRNRDVEGADRRLPKGPAGCAHPAATGEWGSHHAGRPMEILVPIIVGDACVARAARVPRDSASARTESSTVCALARKLDGLASLTEQDRAALEGLIGYVRSVERYAVLVEQDGVADHALIVFAGLAGRYKRRLSGRRQILAYLVPG